MKVAKVSGYDQVRDLGVQQVAMAKATLTLTDEAAWFAKSPDRALILQRLPDGDLQVRLPMALVDKQWQVIDEAQMSQAAMTGAIGKSSAAQGAGMLDKLKSVFSFGGHPAVGKWQAAMGNVLEFTSDSVINNGTSTKATFTTKGNTVTIAPEGAGEAAMDIIVSDDGSTAQISMGGMRVTTLRRVRD